MSDQSTWESVDARIQGLFGLDDPVLGRALERCRALGFPDIHVTHSQAAFLGVLVRAMGARQVLEVGTLGAFSTIHLGRALPEDGTLVTLEVVPEHARVARLNLDDAGLADRVTVLEGPASQTLAQLTPEPPGFDFVFIDADKPGYAEYMRLIIPLCRAGALIVADNVVREGGILDEHSDDEKVRGIQTFLGALALESRVESSVIQLVSGKGYDGMAVSVVVGEEAGGR